MNVVVISEKDAANASLGRIADAFLLHHDKVELYASFYCDNVLACFSSQINKHRLEELNEDTLDWCDII